LKPGNAGALLLDIAELFSARQGARARAQQEVMVGGEGISVLGRHGKKRDGGAQGSPGGARRRGCKRPGPWRGGHRMGVAAALPLTPARWKGWVR
jgi:hypothetical protein